MSCSLVTFSGMADLAYLMELMLPGELPETLQEFKALLEETCAGAGSHGFFR